MRDSAVRTVRPSKLTEAVSKECMALIVSGGAVERRHVEYWFPLSVVVAVKWSDGEVVGVGVIKRARTYTATVAARSGFALDPKMHELGYVRVKDEHQGKQYSRELVEALQVAHEAPLFATTSSKPMRRTLERCGFVKQGNEWAGGDDSMLSLWVRLD